MKRTSLMIDADLLQEAVALSGQKTYSAVVHRALDDYVKRMKAGRILELRGSGLWKGDLAALRGDGRS